MSNAAGPCLDVHANEPVVDARLAQRNHVMVLCHTMEDMLGWREEGRAGLGKSGKYAVA